MWNRLKVGFKNFFINWFDIIEALILLLMSKFSWVFIILGLILAFIAIRRHFRVFKSKAILRNKLMNERVQGNEGDQGAGKTSLMLYMASLEYKASEIYSIVPCKIKGEYCNVLTEDIMRLKKKLPLHSLILGDEITMIFNNLVDKKKQSDYYVAPVSVYMQSIRHFTDGNWLDTSVDMTRLNKQLEEKHAIFNKVLGQDTPRSSYIFIPLYKILLRLLRKYDEKKHKYLGTYRVWTVQTFKPITHENYYYDLSNDKASTDNKGFSNLLEIWAYNNLDYDYNDVYLRELYATLPANTPVKWDSMYIGRKELQDLGYSQLLEYFPNYDK